MKIPSPLKWVFKIIGFLLTGIIIFVALFVGLLSGLAGEPSSDEVARVKSPNGKFEAVLFETNGGATTSFGYKVYVVERGGKASGSPVIYLYGADRNANAYGANLKWEKSSLLVVEYMSAKSKRIEASTVSVGGEKVEVSLREGIIDNAAPPGGMLYNLLGRP